MLAAAPWGRRKTRLEIVTSPSQDRARGAGADRPAYVAARPRRGTTCSGDGSRSSLARGNRQHAPVWAVAQLRVAGTRGAVILSLPARCRRPPSGLWATPAAETGTIDMEQERLAAWP